MQKPIDTLEICVYSRHIEMTPKVKKYFTDVVPNPLPSPGDYINTRGLVFYLVLEDNKLEEHIELEGTHLKILNRIFYKLDNKWMVQLICEMA